MSSSNGTYRSCELALDAHHDAREALLDERAIRADAELAAEQDVERARLGAARLVADLLRAHLASLPVRARYARSIALAEVLRRSGRRRSTGLPCSSSSLRPLVLGQHLGESLGDAHDAVLPCRAPARASMRSTISAATASASKTPSKSSTRHHAGRLARDAGRVREPAGLAPHDLEHVPACSSSGRRRRCCGPRCAAKSRRGHEAERPVDAVVVVVDRLGQVHDRDAAAAPGIDAPGSSPRGSSRS